MKKISVVIVGYKSRQWLTHCLYHLQHQTHWNLEVIYLDNHSEDGSVDYVAEHFPEAKAIELTANLGFAGANNMGIRLAGGDYVLTLNPDVLVGADYLSVLAEALEQNPGLGGVQGKLLQARLESGEVQKQSVIDSTGDVIGRTRRALSRGQGEPDNGQYDEAPWVFGLTGGAALWRKSMLDQVKLEDEYFDEDFFMYKEDTDLCWRARLAGWEFAYLPGAVAWHGRGWGQGKTGRHAVSALSRQHSFKNRHLMMLKNEHAGSWWRHLLWIIGFELGIVLYALGREPSTLKGIGMMRAKWASAWRKRARVQAQRKATPRAIVSWFGRTR